MISRNTFIQFCLQLVAIFDAMLARIDASDEYLSFFDTRKCRFAYVNFVFIRFAFLILVRVSVASLSLDLIRLLDLQLANLQLLALT